MFLSCKDVFKYYLCLYNEGKNKSRYRSLISLKMCPCLNVRNRSVVNEHFMMSIISMFFTISASSQVLELSINLYDQRESFTCQWMSSYMVVVSNYMPHDDSVTGGLCRLTTRAKKVKNKVVVIKKSQFVNLMLLISERWTISRCLTNYVNRQFE